MKQTFRKKTSGEKKAKSFEKSTTIRQELAIRICALVGVLMILLGGISVWSGIRSTNALLKQSMTQLAAVSSDQVSEKITALRNVAIDTGYVARLSNDSVSVEDKQEILNQRVTHQGFKRGNILNAKGVSIFDGEDFSDREYFQMAMQGNAWVSEPLISKTTGELTIIVAAPLWKDGVPDSTVVGVVYFVPEETFLNDIVKSIKISSNSKTMILNKEGTVIADPSLDNVKAQKNAIEDAKSNDSLKQLAAVESKMIQGKGGFGTYREGGSKRFMAYAPISSTQGDWNIGITAPTSDFMSATYQSIVITLCITAAALVAAVLVARKIALAIGNPVAECTARLELLAQGNLSAPVPTVNSRNETRQLALATASITQTLSGIIGDLGNALEKLAAGDFTVKSKNYDLYHGDFVALQTSIKTLIGQQSNTMAQISHAAEQVSGSSDQVSNGAQTLSQGATEQASSVEELASTVTEISAQIGQSADNAVAASQKASEVGSLMTECDQRMKEMVAAMDEISSNSQQIGNIIKTIEDIAFQTNILALNAAVEAARAGEAGKGFAVVADEVRSLAGKSANASKDTAVLIEAAVQSVNKGSEIADATAQILDTVAANAQSTQEMVNQIADASQQQSAAIEQVSIGIDQISTVVQVNSATAEESAAASHELSALAKSLKKLVSQFKLLDQANAPSAE